jgi:hypothetical protein
MSNKENLQDYISETRQNLKEWLDTKLSLYRLRIVKTVARTAGTLAWVVISMFLFFLLIIFSGITAGYWLSSVTGSYVKGFGLVTAAILLLIVLLAVLRKALFVNPIVRKMLHQMLNETNDGKNVEP